MKFAEKMVVKVWYVVCPHCGNHDDGWIGDPRSRKEQVCNSCDGEYVIPESIKVEVS